MNQIILETSAMGVALYCLIDSLKFRSGTYRTSSKGLLDKMKDQHYVFMMLLFTLIVSAASSVLEMCLEKYAPIRSVAALVILNEIFYIFHTVFAFLFSVYVIDMTGAMRHGNVKNLLIFATPLLISQIVLLLNPLTGWIFYIDANYTYHRGELLWILYVLGLLYVAFGIGYFMLNRQLISKLDRVAVLILMFIAVLGIAIQAAFSITVELFFESIAFLGFMLLLEDRRSRERAGRYGRMSKSSIIVIALVFLTVIAMNVNLTYHAGTDQTGKIGETQVNNIKGEMQQTMSESESHLLRFAMRLEQIINENASYEEIEEFITKEQEYYAEQSDGNCFKTYAASPDWLVAPGADLPDDYHAVERVWYIGARDNKGQVYISEPYIDADTGMLCYTFSYTLADGRTVAAMDYTLSKAQDIVGRMSAGQDQFAMVVTDDGTIVGCTDVKYQAEVLSKVLPEYTEMFDRISASNEHRSFNIRVNGKMKVVFSSETSNGWKLILVVDRSEFYSEILDQMILLGAIDLLMVAVIIVFYMVSLNNQARSERTLATTEDFIRSLANDLRGPINDLQKISGTYERQGEEGDAISQIGDVGRNLKELTANLFAFSDIARSRADEAAHVKLKRRRASSASSRYTRNGILGILIASLLVGIVLCMGITARWGSVRIGRETDRYNSIVTVWMQQKKSMLRMLSDVIAADPSVLDDYDKAVKWLDDVAGNYSDMTFAYMANPYNTKHPVIMNNGWTPDEDFNLEDREWYVATERSEDGFSISAPYYDAQTGLYCVTFSRCVYTKDGRFLGVLAIDCLLDKLVGVLDESYDSSSYAFMVDRDGIIINHPHKAYEMNKDKTVNIEDTEYNDVYHNGTEFWMKDYDEKLVASCSEKSELSGFSVVVVQNWWKIYGPVIFMAMIFLIMLVASIIAVTRMINRFIGWQEETNEELVEAAKTAVAAEKEKSRFLAQMSHEIRTPINAVLGMNEMIIRESDDPSIREYAGNIQNAGRSLLGLINSILDFSKIEEGKMEIIPVRYDTVSMIGNLINSVSKRAADKGLVFEAHVDNDLPSTLFGDDMRVSQVAVNLLTNAVKYTQEGRVDLFVEKEEREGDAISLRIRVKDTGIGIKAEDIDKLFESFTRLEETRNRNIEGTGLGMAIVNRLLSMMGSHLEVESIYGQGSQFAFSVRQEIIDEQPIGDFETKARELSDVKSDDTYLYTPDARLLIVDDNDMNLKVISNLLKLNGITPQLASSGEEMLEKLKDGNKYDVIMLDHMMPRMDGIETLRKAREEDLIREGCSVIALTANAVVGARESYLAEGFDDYLSKPVDIGSLEAVLARFLPEEMVEYRNRSDLADEAKDSEKGGKFKMLSDAGIDTKAGLKFCGQDEEFYEGVLAEYLATAGERTMELDNALSRHDMKTYAIKVHSLKSISRTIGASAVSKIAASLENAAKNDDENEVLASHPLLLEEYARTNRAIEALSPQSVSGPSEEDEILEFSPV